MGHLSSSPEGSQNTMSSVMGTPVTGSVLGTPLMTPFSDTDRSVLQETTPQHVSDSNVSLPSLSGLVNTPSSAALSQHSMDEGNETVSLIFLLLYS